MTRSILSALLGLAVLLPAGPVRALPTVLYGFDMDPVSMPRFTQEGFQSVTTCTLAPGQSPTACGGLVSFPPGTGAGAGYLTLERPFTDFRVIPTATTDLDLWADGHRVSGETALLRLVGLAPGSYDLLLLSHNAGGTVLDRTVFSIDGVEVGSVLNQPEPTQPLELSQALLVPVVVGPSGTLEIGFRRGEGLYGVLNGVIVVPEPAAMGLLGVGLSALGLRRGRRRTSR